MVSLSESAGMNYPSTGTPSISLPVGDVESLAYGVKRSPSWPESVAGATETPITATEKKVHQQVWTTDQLDRISHSDELSIGNYRHDGLAAPLDADPSTRALGGGSGREARR
jgi:hypothetical protein